jgi:signal transduction histidine kinase
MAKSFQDVIAAAEPSLTFGEFYDAALATPELAVYVIRVGDDGGFTFEDANDFVAQVAGKPLSEIRGRAPQEVLLPEVAECITNNLRTCVATGKPMAYGRTFDFPGARVSFKTSLIPIARGSRGAKFVVGMTRDVTQETDQFEQAQHQAALLRTLGIALPSAVYLLDMEHQTLRFVGGEASGIQLDWRRGAEAAGPEKAAEFFHPDDWPRVQAHWADLAGLQDGEVCTISYRLLAHRGEFRRHVHREIVFSRDAEGKVKFVLGISEDVSEHDKVEQEVRDLSAHMLTLQIEERRRIAHELHDSTGQHLVAAALALNNARSLQARSMPDADSDSLLAMIDDAAQCLSEAQREIQVLSYLLHPPHLRSQGLAEAIEAFASGFARRAGLKVGVEIAPGANDIDDDTAVHLFRVCQEALTNVYRHADAHRVKVTLEVDDAIRLIVRDDGVGFDVSAAEILGVGLPGMRERMARLGGAVDISSNPAGTVLVANIPLRTPDAGVGARLN